jgi:hypothetical protein
MFFAQVRAVRTIAGCCTSLRIFFDLHCVGGFYISGRAALAFDTPAHTGITPPLFYAYKEAILVQRMFGCFPFQTPKNVCLLQICPCTSYALSSRVELLQLADSPFDPAYHMTPNLSSRERQPLS